MNCSCTWWVHCPKAGENLLGANLTLYWLYFYFNPKVLALDPPAKKKRKKKRKNSCPQTSPAEKHASSIMYITSLLLPLIFQFRKKSILCQKQQTTSISAHTITMSPIKHLNDRFTGAEQQQYMYITCIDTEGMVLLSWIKDSLSA